MCQPAVVAVLVCKCFVWGSSAAPLDSWLRRCRLPPLSSGHQHASSPHIAGGHAAAVEVSVAWAPTHKLACLYSMPAGLVRTPCDEPVHAGQRSRIPWLPLLFAAQVGSALRERGYCPSWPVPLVPCSGSLQPHHLAGAAAPLDVALQGVAGGGAARAGGSAACCAKQGRARARELGAEWAWVCGSDLWVRGGAVRGKPLQHAAHSTIAWAASPYDDLPLLSCYQVSHRPFLWFHTPLGPSPHMQRQCAVLRTCPSCYQPSLVNSLLCCKV